MFRLNLEDPLSYNVEVEGEKIVHPQKGAAMRVIEYKRNDTGPTLYGTIKDNLGRPVNLHGARIKLVMRQKDDILGPDGDQVVVSTQDRIIVLDQLKNRSRGQFQACLSSEDTECSGKYEAEFQTQLKGIVEARYEATYALSNGLTLLVKVDEGAEQTITFNTADFADITKATSQEVVDKINDSLSGATAYVLTVGEAPCFFMISSDSSGGSIEISGGTASEIFGFDARIHKDQKVTVPTEKMLVVIHDDLDEAEEIE